MSNPNEQVATNLLNRLKNLKNLSKSDNIKISHLPGGRKVNIVLKNDDDLHKNLVAELDKLPKLPEPKQNINKLRLPNKIIKAVPQAIPPKKNLDMSKLVRKPKADQPPK